MEKNWVDVMLDDLDEVDVIFKSVSDNELLEQYPWLKEDDGIDDCFKSVSDDVILGLYPWVKKELVEV